METPEENKVNSEQELPEAKEELGRFSALLASIGIEGIYAKVFLFFILGIVLVSAFISFLSLPPFSFPNGKTISIKTGSSLSDVSLLLSDDNIIRSRSVFEFCSKAVGGDKPIIAGEYLFKDSASSCAVALRIAHGVSGIPAVRITLPEGLANKDMAPILAANLPKFDSAFFLDQEKDNEGYLFPDTYFFSQNVSTQDVENALALNFTKKTDPLKDEITASKHSLSDIIIMASIIEKEATTPEDKAIVSGILWKRIANGMALQVDAPFLYLLGKTSAQLTVDDLQMKSPYNTYRNKGLPPGPIGNPGIVAIEAALNPTPSPYAYYLSDAQGIMHYAKTFEEHVANKAKYLK